MARLFEKSLLLRLGVAMAAITALAFVSMLSSVIIAETTQGAATAINQAGSLRMQSYRIATDVVYSRGMDREKYLRDTATMIADFGTRLQSRRLVAALPDDPGHELVQSYNHVLHQWRHKIEPVLTVFMRLVADSGDNARQGEHAAIIGATLTNIRQRYLHIVNGYVEEIDRFVKLLEQDAESKIQRLRLIQGVALFFTLIIVFVTLFLVHSSVLIPLRDLLACAEWARRGNFSVRTKHEGDDELGRLGRAFNVMAADLSKMYADLEERVHEKTADLERTNRSLELLYNTTRRLNEAVLSDATYQQLLQDIEQFTGAGPGTICLADQGGRRAIKLATTATDEGSNRLCAGMNCDRCMGDGSTSVLEPQSLQTRVVSIPIKEQDQQYGVLLLEMPSETRLDNWQMRLLEAVADHIGIAVNLARQANQSRRLALLEERSVIARELHDSLAQALSYLKIQASRLDASLARGNDKDSAQRIVKELREGITSAYRQLRELLTTFRLQMDGRGLRVTLEDTVTEYSDRSGLAIVLDNRMEGCRLTPHEEIHLVQIVREALSNVVRHAKAQHAAVSLRCSDEGVDVTVEDDGVGLPEKPERLRHYGLAIIKERADGLEGRVALERRPEGGTRLELKFTPAHWRQKNVPTARGVAS